MSANASSMSASVGGTAKTSMIEQALAATRTEADKRRDLVERYKAMGYANRKIASILGVTEGQIRRDWIAIQTTYLAERLPTLHERIQLSVATRRLVQQEAWSVILDPRLDAKSQSRIGAMQTVLVAQDTIDRLEGTINPESLHAAAVAEFVDTVLEVVSAVGGPEMHAEVLAGLGRKVGGTTIGVLLGAPDSPSVPGSVVASDAEGTDDGMLDEDGEEGDGYSDDESGNE